MTTQIATVISDDNPPMTTQMTTPDDNSHFRWQHQMTTPDDNTFTGRNVYTTAKQGAKATLVYLLSVLLTLGIARTKTGLVIANQNSKHFFQFFSFPFFPLSCFNLFFFHFLFLFIFQFLLCSPLLSKTMYNCTVFRVCTEIKNILPSTRGILLKGDTRWNISLLCVLWSALLKILPHIVANCSRQRFGARYCPQVFACSDKNEK
jgi:hypothetical protein